VSTFLFASTPVPAHTTNPIPFAQRLVERGHTVLWYAGRAFHDRLAATGALPLPLDAAEDFGDVEIEQHFPQFAGLTGVRAIKTAFADVFVGQALPRVADLRTIVEQYDVDAMLSDELIYGVGLTSELTGVPWATFGDGPLPYFEPDTPPFGPALSPMRGPVGRLRNRAVGWIGRHVIFAEAQRRYDAARTELGLPESSRPVLEEAVSPYLHLHGAVPSFDYPRKQLPSHMHWVGALRPDAPTDWERPSWWSEVVHATRPVVLVSQGSIRPDLTELVEPTVRALADKDALVVVTTGQADPVDLARAYVDPLPGNVRVEKFVPYDQLLPHVDCFVTNGGYTGVTLALHHGVPLVQAGTTEEKSEIGARIAWTGVGVRLRTTRPSATAVREVVDLVLSEDQYAAAARRVQAEMAEHDAGREGADLLERLVARTLVPQP
jgi:UDP:flavonoid glycosyltransferase YjiC (YdhE family)